ncbi:MAG: hypothetical protein IJS81_04830 [Selenomonadaceae bacterium]|nr:hypothetical protein [Selenomonadaceae bacterium]
MDFSIIVILWIVFMVIESAVKKKKKPPPTPPPAEKGNADFDIPTLANDPNFPGEDVTIFRDENKPAEVRDIGFTDIYRQRRTEKNLERKVESDVKNSSEGEKNSNLPLNLTAESAMNAVVLSEILGKPKALRR